MTGVQTCALPICGLLFTVYAFHVERSGVFGVPSKQIEGFFGGLFGSMAVVTLALALCFGVWPPSLQSFSLADVGVLLYTGLATVLVPVVLLTMLLRYLSAVTLAFLTILEPLVSIAFAYALGAISFSFFGWLGIGCILLSILAQAGAAAAPKALLARKEGGGELEVVVSAEAAGKV